MRILDMIEELLSITEPLVDLMDHPDREAWRRISAATANIRADQKEGVAE